MLSRYNCEEQYSHWNCDDCRKAYARWISAIMLPACTSSPCGMVKPYASVCYQVIQKCPIIMVFTCPDVAVDDRDYTLSGGNYMGLSGFFSYWPSILMCMTYMALITKQGGYAYQTQFLKPLVCRCVVTCRFYVRHGYTGDGNPVLHSIIGTGRTLIRNPIANHSGYCLKANHSGRCLNFTLFGEFPLQLRSWIT